MSSNEPRSDPSGTSTDVKFFTIISNIALAGFAAAIVLVLTWPKATRPAQDFYSSLRLTNFTLIERSGRAVSRAELEGKFLVVGFVFTSCGVECKISGQAMADIDSELGPREDVRLVSLTIDPMTDTPKVLSRFAGELGADPDRWLFLTGDGEVVRETLRASFLSDDEEDGILPSEMPAGRLPLVSRLYLLDRSGQIRGWFDATQSDTPARVVSALREIEEKGGEPVEIAEVEKKVYSTRGVIREIAPDRRSALISHEEIPGYMAKMTMKLKPKDPGELRNLRPGDEITFDMVATAERHWIERLERVGTSTEAATNEVSLSAMDEVPASFPRVFPDFEFLDESGKPLRFSDFTGKTVVFTFIFTRCPLPDYCPRMGSRFQEAREILRRDGSGATNWQFLSISFDPEVDTPRVLSSYAGHYRGGDPDRWRFAVASEETLKEIAPLCNLMIMEDEKTGFSHNLRTVVLDGKRGVARVFAGNEWTAGELAEAVVKTLN